MNLKEASEKFPRKGCDLKTIRETKDQDRAFKACLDWLAGLKPIRNSNRRHGTYGLKHMVERASQLYIYEGTFILAALASGFSVRDIVPGGRSGFLNVSELSLRQAPGFKG